MGRVWAFNVNRFVIFLDEKYTDLCHVLLDSLRDFSSASVFVVSVNFNFHHNCPRVTTIRIDFKVGGLAEFCIERLKLLSTLRGPFILLDADMVANRNVDQLFNLQHLGHLVIQQPAVCGSFHSSTLGYLKPYPGFTYCNAVPMICGSGFGDWIGSIWPTAVKFAGIYRSAIGASIDDETLMNWLRLFSFQTAYMNVSAPDRQLFDFYIGGAESVCDYGSDCYNGRRVTWHLFHGEKNPEKARSMLDQLKSLGPEFLYSSPTRSRHPAIFS